VVLVPFLAVYAVRGRLAAFFDGYTWAVQVSSSAASFEGRSWWLSGKDLASFAALTARADVDLDETVGARVLDYVAGPGLVMLGLGHVVAAVVRRKFDQRTALVLGLALMGALTMHHAFLKADPWHLANASTSSLVLLVTLCAGARRLYVRTSGARVVPAGILSAALFPTLWLVNGAAEPLDARLARLASGDERPSAGPPFRYEDLPRAGDVRVDDVHLAVARYVRAHSKPDDPVYCATWLLGGGAEAFLSERRNPTSFDKPDEIASRRLAHRAFSELKRDPPVLIVGRHFDELDDEAREFIRRGWHDSGYGGQPPILVRNW
jgi:hypothetical protein